MTLPDIVYIGEQAYQKKAPALKQYYRQPHDLEIRKYKDDLTYMGDGYRSGPVRNTVYVYNAGMPEVYRMEPGQETPLHCGWINLWWDLNPKLGYNQFASLLANNYAFTNQTGWPGRFNCLTGENQGKNPPALNQAIICGGAILTPTRVENGRVYIKTMNVKDRVPTAEWVIDNLMFFYATTITPNRTVNVAMKKGTDGKMYPVKVPLITEVECYLPEIYLDKLPLGFIPPSPTWMP